MRISCPHCETAYDVPPAALLGRRALRCARCGRDWDLPGQLQEAPPEVVASPQPEASVAEGAIATSPTPPSAARIGWLASGVVVILALWLAVAWRGDVMRAWPPSTRAYSALGLTSSMVQR